ncbi:Response regulatory domain-containing protein OS=Streptomyces antimycoticus OX=68175 GN=SSPO_054330 PE=4 SV=1 [Streptomyces antimycoticus]
MQPDVVLIDVDEPSLQTQRLVRLIGEPHRPRGLSGTAVSDPQMECLESPTNNPSILKTAVPEFLRSITE